MSHVHVYKARPDPNGPRKAQVAPSGTWGRAALPLRPWGVSDRLPAADMPERKDPSNPRRGARAWCCGARGAAVSGRRDVQAVAGE